MFGQSVSQSSVRSQARQMVFGRLPGAPTPEQVKAWQEAARVIGLMVAAWEFDSADGRAGGGGYSLIELTDRERRRLAVLWEA